jgi:hypothetical protein
MTMSPGSQRRRSSPRHVKTGTAGSSLALALGIGIVLACGILGALGALGLLEQDRGGSILGGSNASPTDAPPPDPATQVRASRPGDPDEPYTLVVIGDGQATIKHSKDTWEHNLTHINATRLPWELALKKDLDGPFDPVITARRLSGSSGSITCQIRRGTKVLVTKTATGPNARVNC